MIPREGYRFVLLHLVLSVAAYFLLRRYVPELGRYALLAAPSVSGFVLMVLDKLSAQARARRIPEMALYAVALLGGSLGILLGMQVLRHKTRKGSFQFALALVFLAQAGLVAAFFG